MVKWEQGPGETQATAVRTCAFVRRRPCAVRGWRSRPASTYVRTLRLPAGSEQYTPTRVLGLRAVAEEPAGGAPVPFVKNPNERVKWALRQLYYTTASATTTRHAAVIPMISPICKRGALRRGADLRPEPADHLRGHGPGRGEHRDSHSSRREGMDDRRRRLLRRQASPSRARHSSGCQACRSLRCTVTTGVSKLR